MALLLTAKEVAEELGMHPGTVRRSLIATGMLPSVRLGHLRRVRRSDLEAFVANLPSAGREPIRIEPPEPILRTERWEVRTDAIKPRRGGARV